MPRALLSNAMLATLRSASLKVVYFAQLSFNDGTVDLCSAMADMTWNSILWKGNGVLQGVDQLQETQDLQNIGYNILLGGCDSSILAEVLGQTNQTKKMAVWLGGLDANGSVIASPAPLFNLPFDYAVIKDDGAKTQIVITCSSEFAALKRVQERRYTPESQHIYFPGDTGFDGAAAAAKWTGWWGKSRPPRVTRKRRTGRN